MAARVDTEPEAQSTALIRAGLIDALSWLQDVGHATGHEIRVKTGLGKGPLWREAWLLMTAEKLVEIAEVGRTSVRWRITARGRTALAQLIERAA